MQETLLYSASKLTLTRACYFQKVDKDFIPGLMYIRDNEATSEEFEAMSLPFTVPNASGQDIQLSSKYTHITLDNRAEYVRLAINYRFVEQVIQIIDMSKRFLLKKICKNFSTVYYYNLSCTSVLIFSCAYSVDFLISCNLSKEKRFNLILGNKIN